MLEKMSHRPLILKKIQKPILLKDQLRTKIHISEVL